MNPILYIFETDSIPEEFNTPENVILLDEGFEGRDDKNPISIDEITFMTSLAILSDRPNIVINAFTDWWKEKCDSLMQFSKLTSDKSQLQEFRAKELEQLEVDGWSIRANFVAYCAISKQAREDAIEIIRESELKIH